MACKQVAGYEGIYEVSDQGEVFSLWFGKRKRLKPRFVRGGYERVALCKDGEPQNFMVHKLVLFAFVGPCPEGMECRHLNGIPNDNRLENLLWGTQEDNYADRDNHGTTARGERHGNAKLTEGWVRAIRCAYSHGETPTSMAEIFSMPKSRIENVIYGRRWKHVV